MKAKELREFSDRELKKRIEDEEEQLRQLRFKHAITGQLENPLILRNKRRLVAR
jgi:large subunit ribosomal protein L29